MRRHGRFSRHLHRPGFRDELARLLGDGWDHDRLAARYGVAATTLYEWRRRLGLPIAPRPRQDAALLRCVQEMRDDGLTRTEIAEAFGLTRYWVESLVRDGLIRRRWERHRPSSAWTPQTRHYRCECGGLASAPGPCQHREAA